MYKEWWKRNLNAFSYDKLDFCPFIFIFLSCSFIFIFRKQDTKLTVFPDEPNCGKFRSRNFKATRKKKGKRERNELQTCYWNSEPYGVARYRATVARVGQFHCVSGYIRSSVSNWCNCRKILFALLVLKNINILIAIK